MPPLPSKDSVSPVAFDVFSHFIRMMGLGQMEEDLRSRHKEIYNGSFVANVERLFQKRKGDEYEVVVGEDSYCQLRGGNRPSNRALRRRISQYSFKGGVVGHM